MRNLVIALVALMFLAGCNTVQGRRAAQGAAIGAAGGAVVGAVAGGSVEAAAAGAAIGAAGGAIIGAVAGRPGYCYARDARGERIVVRCP